MPPIYFLNPPPNPFWDFAAGIEDHPFFAQARRPVPETPPAHPPRPGTEQAQSQAAASAAEASEKAKGKRPAPTVEDPPEVDPSTIRDGAKENDTGFPFRGRGRFAKAFDGDKPADGETEGPRRGGRGCHGHPHSHGHWGQHGPPPFMFGGPDGLFSGTFGGPWRGHPAGPRGRGGCGRGRQGHHHGPGPNSRSPPRGPPFSRNEQPGGFDLSAFLNNLGERLGMDLTSAAEGLGLNVDRFRGPRSNDSDFEPRADIFDTPTHYTIHLSLPGAKKSDIGVDWDGEHSILRVAGVVHRPGVDEDMLAHLAVDGRKRETGVFEKSIRLGTKKDPANVEVQGITAKMVDGVLVVSVPKLEKTFEKKEVRVDGDSSSPERPEDAYMNEKDLLFDAEGDDEDMYDAEQQPSINNPAAPVSDAAKSKQQEAEQDTRSETVDFDDGHEHPYRDDDKAEPLPQYEEETETRAQHDEEMGATVESDWEKTGSEDEGEYVKINVD